MTSTDAEFKKGDVVVYGLHGRGVIEDVVMLSLNGAPEFCYKIALDAKNKRGAVFAPKARALAMGLRRPLDAQDLQTFFSKMAEPVEVDPDTFHWEREEKKVQTLLSEGTSGLAKILNTLHQALRALPVATPSAETTYKVLRSQIQVEIAQALKKHHKQVRTMIDDALGGDYSRPYKKPSIPKNIESV